MFFYGCKRQHHQNQWDFYKEDSREAYSLTTRKVEEGLSILKLLGNEVDVHVKEESYFR